jgi:orc1/cdc6 family replication initiation protein
MAFYSNESTIIRKPYLLSPEYVPEIYTGRAEHLLTLHSCIAPLMKNQRPFNAWLYGPSGSGKTSAMKYVLNTLAHQRPFTWVYVNCWDSFTLYGVLESIATELKLLGVEQQSTVAKLRKVAVALASRPAVIVLDEIDHVPPKERNAIIYNLLELGQVGLVCLAYRKHAIAELDSRVRSRLSPVVLHFPKYDELEIQDILRSRAEAALFPDTCSDPLLKEIAKLAEGDARVAIEALRFAAFKAERERSRAITTEHLADVRAKTDAVKELELWQPLNVHHRVLYELVKAQPGIQSQSLWKSYTEASCVRKVAPLAHRTFLDYVNTMVRLGLLKQETIIGDGRTRAFSTATAR